MKNIVDFPDRSTVEQEAAVWLVLLDRDEAPSSADLASLREWMMRSPAHREELSSLAELWGNTNVLTELAVPLGREKTGRNPLRDLFAVLLQRRAIATGLVFLLVAGAITVVMTAMPPSLKKTNGYYSTAVGQQQTTMLADESTIILNTNTQIKVAFDDKTRTVYLLQGEAYFTVAHAADLPFQVYAGSGRIEAVGTAFTVRINNDDVDVTVTEGKVALAAVDQPSKAGRPGAAPNAFSETIENIGTLSAGHIGTIPLSSDAESVFASSVQQIEAPDIQRKLSWREGLLTFSGEPLEVVVDEISRYTTVKIDIADPNVRSIRIGGRFPVGETTAMLDALEQNFGLRVTRLGHDHVLLSSATE